MATEFRPLCLNPPSGQCIWVHAQMATRINPEMFESPQPFTYLLDLPTIRQHPSSALPQLLCMYSLLSLPSLPHQPRLMILFGPQPIGCPLLLLRMLPFSPRDVPAGYSLEQSERERRGVPETLPSPVSKFRLATSLSRPPPYQPKTTTLTCVLVRVGF